MKTFLKYTFPILTIIILVLAVWLSHQPGDISGRESAHLAQLLGVTDVFLRSACHYMFFFPGYILLWCEPCALGETVMVAVVDVPVVLAGRGFKTYDHRSAFLMG